VSTAEGRRQAAEGATPARLGRPRSESRRRAILTAAGELMMEGGLSAATMEAIAARAGVGKATIYKWWPTRGAVALEGFMVSAADSWSLPEGVSAAEALRVLATSAVRLFVGTPAGQLMRSLAADAQSGRGIETGELRADLDLAATVDLVFAPIYYRLLFGHEPLDEAFAARSIEHVLHGIVAGTE
jgi:hypothetical protein